MTEWGALREREKRRRDQREALRNRAGKKFSTVAGPAAADTPQRPAPLSDLGSIIMIIV